MSEEESQLEPTEKKLNVFKCSICDKEGWVKTDSCQLPTTKARWLAWVTRNEN